MISTSLKKIKSHGFYLTNIKKIKNHDFYLTKNDDLFESNINN